jgi:signal peptidase II
LLLLSLLLILVVLIIDQWLKIYIKTNFVIGQQHSVIGNWFYLHFIENEGMAFGWKINNSKLFLSIFRIVACIAIGWYLISIINKGMKTGFIISISLIFAGAVGNIIDSAFYGMLFSESYWGGPVAVFNPADGGYAGFLYGKVVDMFYFPIITGTYPAWFPFGLAGSDFLFFRPIFNIADSSITVGVLILLIFQRRFIHEKKKESSETGSSDLSEE